jgi:phage tail sheath protein FI
MAQYLSPGVYVEEIPGPRTIEGVSTSTAGFVGPTRMGPISGTPSILTSLSDFVAIYGSLDPLTFDDVGLSSINYVAQSVREFFDNGGSLLYVSRVFDTPSGAQNAGQNPPELPFFNNGPVPYGYSWAQQTDGGSPPGNAITWCGRYPGKAGDVTLITTISLGPNVLTQTVTPGSPPTLNTATLRGTLPFDVVWITPPAGSPPAGLSGLHWAENYLNKATGQTSWRFHSASDNAPGSGTDISLLPLNTQVQVLKATLQINYPDSTTRTNVFPGVTFDPRSSQSFTQQFGPRVSSGSLALQLPIVFNFLDTSAPAGIEIAQIMLETVISQLGPQSPSQTIDGLIASLNARGTSGGTLGQCTVLLEWGSDGARPTAEDYQGTADPSASPPIKTGLKALEDVTDVAIVAAPGSTQGAGSDSTQTVYLNALQTTYNLITHCEYMKYRIAVLDTPDNYNVSQISLWRGQIDSSYAALYYPWVQILDPVTDTEITLPPSGFVAGIYARNDAEVGPHKAPANEVVTDALGFETMLNKGQQDVLNPVGVNCFRFFENRGYLLWGARTATSNTELQYVNLRRYLNYLEHSIDNGTQDVVFDTNGPDTWFSVQQRGTDFLYTEFKNGRLFGTTRAQAFFVRCDQTTMTQNEIDNGQLICLIGVALLRPAEFVIFRIGQFTASAS